MPGQRRAAGAHREAFVASFLSQSREGGLVLLPGVVEIEPRFRYQHRTTNQLELVSLGGQVQVAQVDSKLDAYQLSLGLRAGLPWSSQLEFFLPYASNRQQVTGTGGYMLNDSASGFGNSELGWTRPLYTEPGGFGMLASVRWVEPVSDTLHGPDVAAGSSFRSLQGRLLLVTRRAASPDFRVGLSLPIRF